MGLSTLLHLDQESKQTMVFTSVRCDAADHIYLTATIDEQEYLMALDSQGNLCPVQGYSTDMLEVASAFQWVRSSTGGMLLLEQDANGSSALSHIVVTDGALWKTQVTLADAAAGTVCWESPTVRNSGMVSPVQGDCTVSHRSSLRRSCCTRGVISP